MNDAGVGGYSVPADSQHDSTAETQPVSLRFNSKGLEAAYLTELAGERSVVLLCLFCFDILTYIVRGLQLLTLGHKARDRHWTAIIPQMVNMAILWVVIWSINRRSRKSHGKPWAAAQEEVLLSSAVALAVTSLLLNLQKGSGQDYTFACFFLISATLLLRVRWFVGSVCLAIPMAAAISAPLWGSNLPAVLPEDAVVHLTIAWALGALIAYLADAHRRQIFVRLGLANQKATSASPGFICIPPIASLELDVDAGSTLA